MAADRQRKVLLRYLTHSELVDKDEPWTEGKIPSPLLTATIQGQFIVPGNYSVGDKVKWKWGNGWGRGEVADRFTERVTRNIKGSEVVREASEDEPAYLIVQADGDEVLKGHSELSNDG